MKISFGIIPTAEAVQRTGISSRDLLRHAYDGRLTPVIIEGENYWDVDELDQLVQRILDDAL